MIEVMERVIAALAVSCLLCIATTRMVGIMQQGGYKNEAFFGWLRRKDNLQYNRLSVLALCLALSTAITALCFSFLGRVWALSISAIPFVLLLLWYIRADRKFALKVKTKWTGRALRLFGIYYFFTSLFAYILIAALGFLAEVNGSRLYSLIAYVPTAILPLLLPAGFALANAATGLFENARNKKFIKRAGQVLDEREIIRVAVVGSYGKTSVKNILKTILQERYSLVATPASYNTPMGIAKTVLSEEFAGKQVLIAEMGARKAGDIRELCALVKPDYAIFTGVCEQHLATFGSLEQALAEKSEVLRCGVKKVVCGESLKELVDGNESILFAGENCSNIRMQATKTQFTLTLSGGEIEVDTSLLGSAAVENITLAALLCEAMGLTVEEIQKGVSKLQPTEHRLQLIENGGVYILDDGYNCNIRGAKAALEALARFEKRKVVVTPGIVEGGILEEALNKELGCELAACKADRVILVGETLVGAVKAGYLSAGGDSEKLQIAQTLEGATELFSDDLQAGDCVLFLNDLPDIY